MQEAAAACSRYWEVLEQIDDPEATPDLQLFGDILSRTDIAGTKRRSQAGSRAKAALLSKSQDATSSGAPCARAPGAHPAPDRLQAAVLGAPVSLVGALRHRQRQSRRECQKLASALALARSRSGDVSAGGEGVGAGGSLGGKAWAPEQQANHLHAASRRSSGRQLPGAGNQKQGQDGGDGGDGGGEVADGTWTPRLQGDADDAVPAHRQSEQQQHAHHHHVEVPRLHLESVAHGDDEQQGGLQQGLQQAEQSASKLPQGNGVRFGEAGDTGRQQQGAAITAGMPVAGSSGAGLDSPALAQWQAGPPGLLARGRAGQASTQASAAAAAAAAGAASGSPQAAPGSPQRAQGRGQQTGGTPESPWQYSLGRRPMSSRPAARGGGEGAPCSPAPQQRQQQQQQQAQGGPTPRSAGARAAMQPQSRYKDILDRVSKKRPSSAPDKKGPQPHTLGQWGAAASPELQHQLDRAAGVPAGLASLKSLDNGERELTDRESEMQGIVRALELLQTFAEGTVVRPKFKGHIQEAEEILAELAAEGAPADLHGRDRNDPLLELLRPLPKPPVEFPASAAWDYLVAAQGSLGGVTDLEEIVKEMRRKVKVLIERDGQAGGGAAPTSKLGGSGFGYSWSPMATPSAPRPGASASASSFALTPRDPEEGDGAGVAEAMTPHTAGRTSATQQQLQLLTARDFASPRPGPASPPPRLNHAAGGAADGGGAGGSATGRFSVGGAQQQQQQYQYHAQVAGASGAADAAWGGNPVEEAPGGGAPVSAFSSSPTLPIRHRWPAAAAGGGGGGAASPMVAPPPNSSRLRAGQGGEGEELWAWLENLVVAMQSADSSRLQLGVEGSTSHLVALNMHAFNPYTSSGPRHEVAVDRLVSMVKSIEEHHQLSDAEALELAERTRVLSSVERNSLQAAAVSALDPQHVQRVLYLMIRLATCLGAGNVRPAEVSTLLMGSIELLLREVQWLLSLLHLTQGPASPHLQALHAALKAYETQVGYATKLRSRAEELQVHLQDACDRTNAAEQKLEAAVTKQKDQAAATAELLRRNQTLEQEVALLKAKVARMERSSTFGGSMEIPSAHQRTVAELNCRLEFTSTPPSGAEQERIQRQRSQSGDASSSQIPAAWHPHKPLVAVVDRFCDRALVFDMSAFGSAKNGAQPPAVVDQPRCVLEHELQQQASALAWRPLSGSALAIGAAGGIALWTLSGGSRAPVAGSRAPDGPATTSRGPWLTFLAASSSSSARCARFADLAWSPDGRLLAAASPDLSGLHVWDVAAGVACRVAAGFSALRLLRWAPGGGHLFAASHGDGGAGGGRFFLFETSRWRYQSWDATGGALPLSLPFSSGPSAPAAGLGTAGPAAPLVSALTLLAQLLTGRGGGGAAASAGGSGALGRVTAAHWAPSGRVLLLSFSGCAQQLLALHLVADPPSLEAALMPVALPDLVPQQQQQQQQQHLPSSPACIVDFVWDPRGERLGVLMRAPHPAAGCIALFSTTVDPVVQARLLGFARPPPPLPTPDSGGDGEAAAPPPETWSLSAHQCFSRGALFTLRMGDRQLYNLPMVYK